MRGVYKLTLLFSLYISHGLTFGCQSVALPVYLRNSGVSLELIGLSTLLAVPWLLKFLWVPLVDMFWSHRAGRRKSWIIPLQIILFCSLMSVSYLTDPAMRSLMLGILVMNLVAATQDIAVDGLAVDLLSERELGYGNAAQVVGYKSGMIIGGGILLWLSGFVQWEFLFKYMAVLSLLPLIIILFYNESTISGHPATRVKLKDISVILSASVSRVPYRWLIFFIVTYKFGEIMIDVMYKPFLIDSGIRSSQIGLWVGTYGIAASILGSITGGYIASKIDIYKSLVVLSVLRLLPLLFITSLTFTGVSVYPVIAATLLEHFFGGMLTTSLFAFMMFNVDRKIGATHYTIFAVIEVLGKMPGAVISGYFTAFAGYSGCFITGTFISFAVIFILPLYKKSSERENYEIQAVH